jgi:hypothetical protein
MRGFARRMCAPRGPSAAGSRAARATCVRAGARAGSRARARSRTWSLSLFSRRTNVCVCVPPHAAVLRARASACAAASSRRAAVGRPGVQRGLHRQRQRAGRRARTRRRAPSSLPTPLRRTLLHMRAPLCRFSPPPASHTFTHARAPVPLFSSSVLLRRAGANVWLLDMLNVSLPDHVPITYDVVHVPDAIWEARAHAHTHCVHNRTLERSRVSLASVHTHPCAAHLPPSLPRLPAARRTGACPR